MILIVGLAIFYRSCDTFFFLACNNTNLVFQVGPGYVEITMLIAKGKVYMTTCMTPTGPLRVRITGRLYARPFHILIARFLLSVLSKVVSALQLKIHPRKENYSASDNILMLKARPID